MRRLDHPGSGRPWVIGRWADSDLTIETAGDVSVVLLGCASLGVERLRCLVGRVRSVEDLDRLSSSLAGAFHLIGSIRGSTRVQGTVSTSRQVFHARIDGVTVAADRPYTLARLAGAGIDEDVLALHLLSLCAPGNLAGRPLWRGVESLDLGEYLRVDPGGTHCVVRWWTPPASEVTLDTGVKMVREALTHAVEARTSHVNRVSADLSGGLDSTSLCFLATPRTHDLLTTHYAPMDAMNDDAIWAERARTALPHADHVVFEPDESPEWYGDYTLGEGDLEGPYPVLRTRGTVEHLARQVSALGASRHLQGSGGDELFRAGPVWLHSLLRTRPLAALRLVRGARSLWRWTLPNTVRNLADQATYPQWLNHCAERLTESAWSPAAGWENVPQMPVWATRDAVSAARRLLADAAKTQPWSRLRIHHELLSMMRLNGHINRRASQVTSRFGVSYEAPYIDDRVIEAVMAIRLEDRTSLTEYKPVLKRAMRGIVPDEILTRRSKGDYSPHLYSGIRRHQQRILDELGPDSHLARLGLIDPDAVRRTLASVHPDARTLAPADPTLACEAWLRTLASPTDRRPT
jgi:asparagine synthase (glutamine-hydrolysing)